MTEYSAPPAFRSSSLPNPVEQTRTSPFNTPDRRDSSFMASEGPITPPISPGHSDDEDSGIIVDSEPRYSGHSHGHQDMSNSAAPHRPLLPEASSNRTSRADRDSAMAVDSGINPTSPRPAARHLEDEQPHANRGSLKLTDFEVKGTLGTGTFGRVLLVRLRSSPPSSQNIFAMKILRKTDIVRLRQVEHVNAERYILSRVQHPFIVDLYATFQDSLNIYMLLSYVPGGELFTHLRRAQPQRFTADVTRFYLATIILALKTSCLLDSRGYLRLTDFGFAKIVDDRTWTLCGTPEYLAPEIIQSDGHGKAADWWACGILCYEMMVGYPPFFDETPYGIYEKILKGKIHWPKDMDRLSKDLIKAFLHPDRSQRLGNMIGGSQDVLNHPWFRGVDWDALERHEIRAPIIPQVASVDDTRHFSRLPLPPADEIPGLIREEQPPALQQQFDPISYQFMEF
ncbi:serine/threonine protein kinase, AGC [Steccherinum ochraceum]|uniref:cAMP-dependent protein kinase n=1 Tax=Steccherinum ochraceum TaxID=92696 RepID=A0A4R0R428_9APHY|nr:serine/threonine protein kinase, AGC [Steccherinum ochraceum]